MKKIIYWVLPITLLFSACKKDGSTPDRTDTDIATNGRDGAFVKNPLKVSFFAIPDFTQGFIDCLPAEYDVKVAKKMNIGGTASHFGQIQMTESYIEHTVCNLDAQTFLLTAVSQGQIVAANGDLATFTSTTLTNVWDMTFTGTVLLNGGTGRFEGCSGEVIMTGSQDATTLKVTWTADGYIMMKKK